MKHSPRDQEVRDLRDALAKLGIEVTVEQMEKAFALADETAKDRRYAAMTAN